MSFRCIVRRSIQRNYWAFEWIWTVKIVNRQIWLRKLKLHFLKNLTKIKNFYENSCLFIKERRETIDHWFDRSSHHVHLPQRPRKSLKIDFRRSVPRKSVRVRYHWKWFLKLYTLSYSDSSFIPWVRKSLKSRNSTYISTWWLTF